MAKDDTRDLAPILSAAAAKLNKRLKTFQLEVGSPNDPLVAKLNGETEWPDAIAEAWSFADHANDLFLTDAGLALLEHIRSGDLDSDFVLERTISHKLGFYGREHCIEPYLYEIRKKALIDLNWESKGTRWGERPMYRLWIGPAKLTRPDLPRALNPVLSGRLDIFKKSDVDSARRMIYDHLLNLNPAGNDVIYLVAISTLRELRRSFPHYSCRTSAALAKFFGSISLSKQVHFGYDFRERAAVWTVWLEPEQDWQTVLTAVRTELAQPSLKERFGLRDEAAKLLEWVEHLPEDKKLLGRLTPIVEDANEKWIGLEWPWRGGNTAAYLQVLIDEINECTDYYLRLTTALARILRSENSH